MNDTTTNKKEKFGKAIKEYFDSLKKDVYNKFFTQNSANIKVDKFSEKFKDWSKDFCEFIEKEHKRCNSMSTSKSCLKKILDGCNKSIKKFDQFRSSSEDDKLEQIPKAIKFLREPIEKTSKKKFPSSSRFSDKVAKKNLEEIRDMLFAMECEFKNLYGSKK